MTMEEGVSRKKEVATIGETAIETANEWASIQLAHLEENLSDKVSVKGEMDFEIQNGKEEEAENRQDSEMQNETEERAENRRGVATPNQGLEEGSIIFRSFFENQYDFSYAHENIMRLKRGNIPRIYLYGSEENDMMRDVCEDVGRNLKRKFEKVSKSAGQIAQTREWQSSMNDHLARFIQYCEEAGLLASAECGVNKSTAVALLERYVAYPTRILRIAGTSQKLLCFTSRK